MAALIRQWKWKPRFRCASKASKPSRVRADLLPSLARPPISGFNRCLWCVCGISIGRQSASREAAAVRGREGRRPRPHFARTYSLPLSLFGTPYLEMQEMGERDGGFTSEAAHIPFSSSSPASPTAAAPAAAAAAHRGGVESRTSENEIERAGGREEEGEGGLELDEAIRFPITITNVIIGLLLLLLLLTSWAFERLLPSFRSCVVC